MVYGKEEMLLSAFVGRVSTRRLKHVGLKPGLQQSGDQHESSLFAQRQSQTTNHYHAPTFGMLTHGSCGASALPFCNNSIEMLSGERTKAM